MEGRRERKKLQTRRAISDVATALFLERGFDAVTVAEVARAADVAVQTVFNHFPTKEDLFFDDDGWWAGPGQAIRAAADGADPLDVLEAHYRQELRARGESGQLATWKQFSRTIEESPALLARQRQYLARMEESIAEALRARDPQLGDLRSALIAAQYAAAQKVLEGQLAKDAGRIESAIAEVFGVLRHGLLTASSD
ncbi:TetR/AcrR family transcriptional regulator [Kribbella sp. NPDC050124]|uniref:TetR/AcrR family transcriptional regulator n=1 Tax=Kribbella sp. NPDC050124 TaxID=3364114 RepID=UPI0037BB2EF9